MSSIEVRPFRRPDREQVTALVNAHAAAVVPSLSASVNTVMSQLERDPGEFIVDPWVRERLTLVAEQRQRVVAAAHLLRYSDGDHVSDSYRGSGEIRWLLFWPEAPYWRDAPDAGAALAGACVAQLERWSVSRQYADGSLPVPGVYGVPEQWPHIRDVYERAGFAHTGHVEMVFLAEVGELLGPGRPPIPDLGVRRSLGINGTRLSAVLGQEVAGFIEVDTDLGDAGRLTRLGGVADIGNLHVAEAYRRQGVATWLFAHAAEWLRLGRVERLLGYAWPTEAECVAFLESVGFRVLTTTQRGWTRTA
jgi:ribosomal protein S18 acetylase RimI-like enzyme